MRAYITLMKIWTAVFGAVGLWFLLLPATVGQILSGFARIAGLSANVEAPAGTLGWVLSVSLMVSVTGLAACCVMDPVAPGPFRTLLAAKLMSTLLFSYLAASLGSAWIVCALGDGFVAGTLIVFGTAAARECGRLAPGSSP